jgi:hypothetical protein
MGRPYVSPVDGDCREPMTAGVKSEVGMPSSSRYASSGSMRPSFAAWK